MSKVSVIIPTYNRASLLKDAIDSVLTQTYQDFEIIVVDDGSNDNTKQVLDDFLSTKGFRIENKYNCCYYSLNANRYTLEIRYFYQENKGLSSARNTGIRNAKGELFAFLDDDDLWLPDKLKLQVDYLQTHLDVDFIYAFMKTSLGGQIKPKKPALCVKDLLYGCRIPPSTALVRKKCFNVCGYFDENMRNVQDVDMWLRILLRHKVSYIPECLAVYGVHGNNISSNRVKAYTGEVYVLEKVLHNQEIPVSCYIKKERLAKAYYLLAQEHARRSNHGLAAGFTGKAIVFNPFLGRSFFSKKNSFLNNALKIVKPYGAYPYYCLLAAKKRMVGVQ